MSIYKRAHVRGMVHTLTEYGVVRWPSKIAMDEAADEVADSFSDEEMPEVAPEVGLDEDTATAALERIVEVAEELGNKVAQTADGAKVAQAAAALQKTAADTSWEDAASDATRALLEKAAEETKVETGPDVPGETPPTPDLGATAEAEVDAVNNPSSEVVVPQGTTAVDTKPGAVGKEEKRPDQPGAQANPPMNEAAKTAETLQNLNTLLSQLSAGQQKEASMDGASLSGGEATGPAPEPRVDVGDNLDIPGVKAPAQGKTNMDVPAKAEVGATKAQPAGTPGPTSPTPNEPAKARKTASTIKEAVATLRSTDSGRALLRKIAETCDELEEKKKKEEKEKEKEASVASALESLVSAID